MLFYLPDSRQKKIDREASHRTCENHWKTGCSALSCFSFKQAQLSSILLSLSVFHTFETCFHIYGKEIPAAPKGRCNLLSTRRVCKSMALSGCQKRRSNIVKSCEFGAIFFKQIWYADVPMDWMLISVQPWGLEGHCTGSWRNQMPDWISGMFCCQSDNIQDTWETCDSRFWRAQSPYCGCSWQLRVFACL